MFNVGAGEMFAIMLLALIVLGPERLPKAMGQLGRALGQLRRMSSGFQDEVRRAMDPDNAPFRPGEETLPPARPAIEDEVKVVNAGDPESTGTDHRSDGEVDRSGTDDPDDDEGPSPDLRAAG